MANQDIFTHVEPDLFPVLEQLRRREPIFHRPESGMDIEHFESATSADFWEVGASGRRYSREFVLDFKQTIEIGPVQVRAPQVSNARPGPPASMWVLGEG